MKLLYFIAAAAILCLSQNTFASHWSVTSFTTKNGLPSNSIHAVYQTRDRYLWFATEEGLVRFNGYTFTVFNKHNQPYIESNFFNNIFQDKDGTIWVGSEGGGCYTLDGDTLRKYHFPDAEQPKNIYNFLQDSSGALWILSDFKRIYRHYNNKWTYFTRDAGLSNEDIATASVDEQGTYIFGSSYNSIYEFVNGSFHRVLLPPQWSQLNDTKLGFDFLRRTKDGTIIIGICNKGVFAVNRNSVTLHSRKNGLPSDRVKDAFFGSRDHAVIGTFDAGVIVQDGNTVESFSEKDGLPSNDVLAVFEDNEKNIWAGTRGGIAKLSKHFIETISEPDNAPKPIVWSIAQDDGGDIWLGTHGEGVIKASDGALVHMPALSTDQTVYSIIAAKDGSIWTGTERSGAVRYRNGVRTKFDHTKGLSFNAVSCMLESRDGSMWVGTDNGVNHIVHDTVTVIHHDTIVSKQIIRCLYEDRQGNIWIGTDGYGIYRYQGKSTLHLSKANGLSDDGVFAIHQDDEGIFWFGTVSGGLNRYDGRTITQYNAKNGLFDDAVFAIREDEKKNFWISCNKGLYTVSREQLNDVASGRKNALQCISFGISDGMRTEECNGGASPASFTFRDGRIAFATAIGIAVVDPKKVIADAEIPRLTIERIGGNEQQFLVTDNTVTLPPDVFHTEIEYAGITFRSPERVRYRYKLNGFDHDWNDAGARRTAYYTNIPPGSFEFLVESSDARGNWTKVNQASMNIVVLAPYYKTWWFRSFIALSLIIFGVWLYRFRVEQLLRVERMRGRIATDLHDDIGTSLTRIALFSDVAKRELDRPQMNAEKTRSMVQEIGETSRGVIEAMNDIVWTVDPRNDAFDNVTLRMKNYASKILSIKEITHTISIDPDLSAVQLPIDYRRNTFLIFKEALNNIIKYSEAENVQIVLQKNGPSVIMTVRDDGKGFASSSRASGNGLRNFHERAVMMNGECTVVSEEGKGTTVTLTFEIP